MGTAIDWLVEELKSRSIDLNKWNSDLVEQAKEMEKQQLIQAAADHCYPTCELARIDAEQYYNKTFKSK